MDKNDEVCFENALIKKCGLHYCGHGNSVSFKIVLEGNGWGLDVNIPMNKIGKFMRIFDYNYAISDEIEDGIFVNEIENVPVRVMFDGNTCFSSKIIGIGNIISSDGGDDFFII